MLHIFLFRHAHADRPPGVSDFDRPLSAKGRGEALSVGRMIAGASIRPDVVLLSPAARTRETWAIARRADPGFDAIPVEPLPGIYETTPERVLADPLGTLADTVRAPLLVGHNPWIEELARLLLRPSDRAVGSPIQVGMRTAAFAAIALPATSWREVGPGQGRLETLLSP